MMMTMMMKMNSRRMEMETKNKTKGEKKEGHEAEETRLKNPSLPADDTAALCLTVSKRGGQRFAK